MDEDGYWVEGDLDQVQDKFSLKILQLLDPLRTHSSSPGRDSTLRKQFLKEQSV